MKKVIMYKYFNPDRLFGGYGWSIEEVWDDWNHIYSDPYEVEIPDDFFLGENVCGEQMYYRKGDKYGYSLYACNPDNENGSPCLTGGDNPKMIKLKVIGKVEKGEE